MMFGHTISYILAGICSVLLCAYTIKILPSKIGNGTAFHCFCNISLLYSLFLASEKLRQLILLILFYLHFRMLYSIILYSVFPISVSPFVLPAFALLKVSPAVPEASPSPAQVSMPVETPSADTSDSEQNDPPAVKNAPDPDVPLCVPAVQSQKDSVSTKAVIHFSVSKRCFSWLPLLLSS